MIEKSAVDGMTPRERIAAISEMLSIGFLRLRARSKIADKPLGATGEPEACCHGASGTSTNRAQEGPIA
ncbi:MAG: hypothetical protein HY292_01285 [Planctomycetes bacterium]|nr:hypothetical protein [Planctomycetota bacterium]